MEKITLVSYSLTKGKEAMEITAESIDYKAYNNEDGKFVLDEPSSYFMKMNIKDKFIEIASLLAHKKPIKEEIDNSRYHYVILVDDHIFIRKNGRLISDKESLNLVRALENIRIGLLPFPQAFKPFFMVQSKSYIDEINENSITAIMFGDFGGIDIFDEQKEGIYVGLTMKENNKNVEIVNKIQEAAEAPYKLDFKGHRWFKEYLGMRRLIYLREDLYLKVKKYFALYPCNQVVDKMLEDNLGSIED